MTFADTGARYLSPDTRACSNPTLSFHGAWGARPPEIPTPPSVRPLRSPRRGRGGVRDNILEVGSTVTVEGALLRLKGFITSMTQQCIAIHDLCMHSGLLHA